MRGGTRLLFVAWALSASLAVAGCALDALKLAPSAADQPWQAAKEPGLKTAASQSLAERKDFSVPANPELALIASPVALDTRPSYDLAQLIDLAQRSNPVTRNAWEKARQAALGVGMAEATLLPVLTANVIGGVQKTTTPVEVPLIGRRDVDTTLKGVTPALALQWLVFDFGQRQALVECARQGDPHLLRIWCVGGRSPDRRTDPAQCQGGAGCRPGAAE